MRREIQGIKRVGSVSSTDAVHRMNQYRAGLSARDWGISQRARIEGATPGAIKL